jgi:septal ring-binding cell division protein DamX
MSFEGEIAEIDLIDKLVGMGRDHFTGAIRFENDGIIKIVYFKAGDILSASTNDRADSIDEILLRAGKVTREHVKQALAKRKESETLGDALLGLGFITRKELTWARRAQAIGILRSLRGWTAGQYTIVSDYLPKREEGTLFPLPQMLVELIVTETDRARFDRATDGGSAVFHKAPDFDEQFRKLGLNQDAEDIVQYIDGSNTAADVAAQSGKDAFNVYKLLEALRALGLLTKAQGSPEVFAHDTHHDDFAVAGVADAADAWNTDTTFGLDDEPALTATPAPPVRDPGEDAPSMVWGEPASIAAPEVVPPPPRYEPQPAMPAWHDEPAQTQEVPVPPIPPPPPAHDLKLDREPQWGFDEAQIETARRAAVPVRSAASKDELAREAVAKASKPTFAVVTLLVAVMLVILGAAGWLGWQWWQKRNATPEPVIATRTQHLPRPHIPLPTPTPAPTAPPAGAMVITPTTAGGPLATTVATTTIPPNTTTVPATSTAPTAANWRDRKTAPPATARVAPPRPPSNSAPPPRLERSTTSGNTVITNSGGPVTTSPATDATRAKYDAMARQSAAAAAGYAIQFELVCETASLSKAIAAGGDKVWFTPTTYKGRSCYRVYWGHYNSAAEAQAATGEIPASLRESTPTVVRVK